MDICESFLNAYRDLEEVLGAKYGQKLGTVQLYASGEGEKYAEELNLFREMRNLLSHHGRIGNSPAVLPSREALNKLLEILDYAKNPPVAASVATPKDALSCADLSQRLSMVLETMEEKGFSHIPVLTESGRLYGVFSVGTLFAYVKSNPQKSVEGLKLMDIADLLPPEKHSTEKFAFTGRDASLLELKEIFRLTGPTHRRVAAVFVTSNGEASGRLLGMITPWDIIKAENNKKEKSKKN